MEIANRPPSSRRTHPAALLLVALVCFCAGLAVVFYLRPSRSLTNKHEGESLKQRSNSPPEQPSPALLPANSTAIVQNNNSKGELETDRGVQRDRVAYLRCRYPGEPSVKSTGCKRDILLEEEIWKHIETLAGCHNDKLAQGEADLRLYFHVNTPVTLSLRKDNRPGTERLHGPSVLSCLQKALSQVKAPEQVSELQLSFRFKLLPSGALTSS